MSIPNLTPPWTRIPLVHDTTDLFDPETMTALDARYVGAGDGGTVPDGGTTGQVLTKDSGVDQDISWQDVPEGGIPASILDAKGDIIAATAADTASRLAVGTDGQVLTADSGAGTGLAWTTPATAVSDVPFAAATACAVNSYMSTIPQNGAVATMTLNITDTYAYRFTPSVDMTADRVAIWVSTPATGALCRIGVYADVDGTGRAPGALIADFGTLALAGLVGAPAEITINQSFTAGTIYWIAFCGQVASTVIRSLSTLLMPRLIAGSQADALSPPAAYMATKSGVGALGDPWSGTTYGGGTNVPGIVFRRSA